MGGCGPVGGGGVSFTVTRTGDDSYWLVEDGYPASCWTVVGHGPGRWVGVRAGSTVYGVDRDAVFDTITCGEPWVEEEEEQ